MKARIRIGIPVWIYLYSNQAQIRIRIPTWIHFSPSRLKFGQALLHDFIFSPIRLKYGHVFLHRFTFSPSRLKFGQDSYMNPPVVQLSLNWDRNSCKDSSLVQSEIRRVISSSTDYISFQFKMRESSETPIIKQTLNATAVDIPVG